MAGLHFDATFNNADVMRKVQESKKAFTELANSAEIQGRRIDAAFEKISLKSLERVQEIMKDFPKEVQGIESFKKQIDDLDKHIEIVNQRIVKAEGNKLSVTFKDPSSNINVGDVLKQQVYEGSHAINTLTEKIIKQKTLIKDIEHDVRTLGEAYRKAGEGTSKGNALFADFKGAKRALQEEKNALFELQTQQAQARLSVRKLRDEQNRYQKSSQDIIDSNNKMALSFKKALGVIGGVAAFKQLGSEVIKVRGEFQALQTAIETLVGKDMAGKLIPQIKELAKVSPLTLSDLVGAEKMMLGFNIKPEDTIRYLQSLGDISMGNSQKFTSLTLAFSQMSAAGKLMGQDLNQMINAGFNPLQTIAEKTGKSIATLKDEMSKGAISAEMVQQAFIDATSAGGKFYGMSENASKTINGQISMMQDAWDSALNEIGQKSEEVIMKGIQVTTSLIENYETVGKVLTGLIVTYGVYRTAVMLVTAAESKHTLVEIGLTNVRVMARKAQLALNAAMLTNPYVLLAVAVGGLIIANLTLVDTTRQIKAAEDAYNNTRDEAIAKEQKLRVETDKYLSVAENNKAATEDRKDALVKLIQKYPAIFEKYKTEAEMLQHILDIHKEIDKYEMNKSVTNSTNELNDVNKQISDLEKLAKQRYHGGRGLTNAENAKLEMLKNKRSELEGTLKKKDADAILSDLTGYSNSQIEAAIKDRERLLAKMQLKGATKGTITGKSILSGTFTKEELEGQMKLLKVSKAEREAEKKTGKEWLAHYKSKYEEADKAYNDFIKSKTKMSDVDRDKELKRLKELRDVAKTTYENKGGVVSSSSKQETEAEKARKQTEALRAQQEKYSLLLDKQRLDRQRQSEDIEYQLAQSTIDAMSDGFDKIQAQRELDNKKEIQSLKRQKEDYIRAIIQAEKEEFDAQEDLNAKQTKSYEKKTFNPTTITVDTTAFDSIIDNTSRGQLNERIRNQEEAWNEYLIKYGTFQQKKDAINRKYTDAINKSVTAGEAASLQKEWKEALSNLDLSKLKEEINWEMIFGDLSKVTKDQLTNIKRQLQEFKKSSEFQNATPEQIQVIEGAINSINNAMVDKGGFFGGMIDSVKELKIATEELKKAEEELAEANKKGTNAEKEEAQKKVNQAKNRQQNAQTNVEKSNDKTIQNLTAVGDAIAQLGSSAEMSLSSFGNAAANIVDAFTEAGSKIGGLIGAIFSILEGIQTQGLDGFVKNIIGNVAGAIGGIFDTLTFGAFGLKGADYSEYDEMVAKYDSLLDVWDQLLDKKKAYIKESYGPEATKAGQEALDLLNSEREITKELASSRLDAGKSAGSHSINYRMWKGSYDYNGTNWKDVAPEISNALGGVDFSSMWSMLNMSSEQLEWIKTNYSGLWAHMDGDFQGYLENIIKYGDTEKEILESINEQLTQMSFDSLFDGFLNTLMDMDASSKDFADNFEEYMRKAIFTSMFAKNYEDELSEWYKAFAKANDKEGGITAGDVKELRNRWDNIVNGALADREAWEQVIGGSGSSTSQSSNQKGFAAMSQDTGEELNGRFTALQISNEEIKNSMLSMLVSMNLISVTVGNNSITLSEIRNLALSSNSYLEDIAGYQKKIVTDFGIKLDNINNGIKQFNGKY